MRSVRTVLTPSPNPLPEGEGIKQTQLTENIMSAQKIPTIIGLVISMVAIATAQQRPPRSSTAGLMVESTFAKKGVPSYQQVTYRDSQVTKGSWTSRFDKIPGWQLPEGELPILAVRVYPF